MKLQTILLLTGIAAGLMTVSCETTADEDAEAFFGPRKKAKTEKKADDEIDVDFYTAVNAHIDRRLNEFNEKEEAKLPVFSSLDAKSEFMELSFIKSAQQISLLSIDFSGAGDSKLNFVIDRESRTLTRTTEDKTETFAFEPFTNGVTPVIPADAHIIYAFVTDFNRIAETISLRCYEKLAQGENPAIAKLANEANLDKNGKKIDKNLPEIKPNVVLEPIEYRVDNRWCQCYDVKLKSICAPAVAMAIFVSNEEKTISRLDVILDDETKIPFIMDWREQDGIVLPRVIRRFGDDPTVFFREDAKVILKSDRALEEALAAADAATEASADAEAESEKDTEEAAEETEDGEDAEFDLGEDDGFEEE